MSLPQPAACAAFMSLVSKSGSVAFSFGRFAALPMTQRAAATFRVSWFSTEY